MNAKQEAFKLRPCSGHLRRINPSDQRSSLRPGYPLDVNPCPAGRLGSVRAGRIEAPASGSKMRNAIPFVLALLVTSGRAQDLRSKDVSPAARDYHAYRQRVTVPPYGLAKARAAIRTIRPTKGGGENSESLASPAWPRMSVPERFTYCMLHGEVASQNCDVMPWVVAMRIRRSSPTRRPSTKGSRTGANDSSRSSREIVGTRSVCCARRCAPKSASASTSKRPSSRSTATNSFPTSCGHTTGTVRTRISLPSWPF